ncbi:universal stress protein [Streptomyces sp. NBC_01013]|uniref:universal stress protein n=1 Tax=Streptomyces sp. NBC_01013 TaxID=2903718 RepID=UPI00386C28B9|nr:universal stress protein [Streptomyces sp. NBC_01013]
MNDLIIVGLDGSPASDAAAHWGAREALLRKLPLRLVHAVDRRPPFALPVPTTDSHPMRVQALLSETADHLRTRYNELEVSAESCVGKPADVLRDTAANAHMIVLGARGLSSVTGYVLGSVAMAVIRATVRPVVMVRAGDESAPPTSGRLASRDLVVGVDISRPCDALLAFAFDEAARRGCALHVLHSWSLPPLFGYGAAYDPRVHAQLELDANAALADALSPWRAAHPAVDVTSRASVGHAATDLVGSSSDAALAIVGRRIRRSAVGSHIGPVTHAVLHHSRAPVAVIAHA